MEKHFRIQVRIALFLIASAVVLGALGAHSLKEVLNVQALTSFETAVRYQLTMALGAGLLLALQSARPHWRMTLPIWFLFGGILLFSGSIYGLVSLPAGHALRAVLGPITPLGGLSMVLAWVLAIFRTSKK